MNVILHKQKIHLKNLLSFKGKVTYKEFMQIGKDMDRFIQEKGAEINNKPLTATLGIDNSLLEPKMDIELLFPINQEIKGNDTYHFIKEFKLENALMIRHCGNINLLQETCDILNQYIIVNNLIPVSPVYNITTKLDSLNQNNEVEIYIGIS